MKTMDNNFNTQNVEIAEVENIQVAKYFLINKYYKEHEQRE